VGTGATLAGLLALAFAWEAMFGLRREEDAAAEACVLLVEDLTVGGPLLNGSPPWRESLPPAGEGRLGLPAGRPAAGDS
jgi:hypothetical protein